MSYKEKINRINKEAFQEAKRLLMENNGRSCIYFSEGDEDNYDDFSAIVSPGFFQSEYVDNVKGVRVAKEGEDPYGEFPALEINYVATCDDECYWTSANNMDSLFYADLADFVKNNLDKAITPEEYEALESNDD